jgi:hypothetical protein
MNAHDTYQFNVQDISHNNAKNKITGMHVFIMKQIRLMVKIPWIHISNGVP